MTKVVSRTRLNPEHRRQQLLDAAIHVFARRGIGRAAHADIAEQTGVSVPTVFNYFNTREDLVDAVLSEVEDFFAAVAQKMHGDANKSPIEIITGHAFAFLQVIEQRPEMVKIWLEWSASVRDDTWPRYMEYTERLIDIIAPTLQRGLDQQLMKSNLSSRDLARILIGQAHPVSLACFSPNKPVQDMVRFVILGIQAVLGIDDGKL